MKRLLALGGSARRGWLVAIGLAAVAVAGGIGHARHGKTKPNPGASPVPVKVTVNAIRPQRATLERSIEQPGQIEAFERTALYSKIPGFVKVYHRDIGDKVRKGQLLAELWVPEIVEDVHQKEATVAEDEALIVRAREMLRVDEAKVIQAEAAVTRSVASRTKAEATRLLWILERRRTTQLVGRGASTREELDEVDEKFKTSDAAVSEAVADIELAKATLVESKAQRARAVAEVGVAEARLRVARADRDRAAAVLGYARIESPYDGVVSRRELNTGDYVQPPGGDAASATPLFEVVKTDVMRIIVDVPEADATLVHDGGPARVQVQALGDREITGCVARSSWALNSRTRTLRAEIDLPNTDDILRPGMYATARIPVSRPEALTLPNASVFLQDDQAWVVRLVDNKAFRTPVRLGLRDRNRVEVLRKRTDPAGQGAPGEWEDFVENDLVVADSPSALLDGQQISIRPAEAPVLSLSMAAKAKKASGNP